MPTLNLMKICRLTKKTVDQNREGIFAITATISGFMTTVFAITGQRKADKEIAEINKDRAVNDEEPLTAKDEVLISAKHHGWTLVALATTAGGIWYGYYSAKGRYLELANAYGLLSKGYDDLQKAIDETGHRDEVKEKVLKNAYEEHKEKNSEPDKDIHESSKGNGKILFLEEVTGQTFWGDSIEDVKAVINKINWRMNSSYGDPEQSMDDLLIELGLRRMGGELGSRIGWDTNWTGIIDPKFTRPDPGDDDPCENVWVLGYFNPPKENFGRPLY